MSDFLDILREEDVVRMGRVSPGDVPFDEAALASCETNQCGCYNASWGCPPAAPSLRDWKKEIRGYDGAVVFQADYPFADDFDYESMEAGARSFYALSRRIEARARDRSRNARVMGAGACRECSRCSFPSAPCVRPEGPAVSLEACGVNVRKLCEAASLPYNAGDGQVTYTGLLLY